MSANSHSSEAADRARSSVPSRWIDTIRFTLADIIVRGEWDDFGLFRILNRISFICKNHLIFVVGFKRPFETISKENRTDNSKYTLIANPLISSLDPEFFELTFNLLKEGGLIDKKVLYKDFINQSDGSPSINFNKNRANDYAIYVWGSPIFVIVMELFVDKTKIGSKPNLDLKLVTTSSQLGTFLTETLKPFDGMESNHPELYSSRMPLPQKSAERGLTRLREANVLKKALKDDPCPLDDTERLFVKKTFESVVELVDGEYQRLRISPLLNKNAYEKSQYISSTNVMFFSKLFNSETIRYKHYKYNAQPLIPDTQVQDLIKTLAHAKREDYIPFDGGAIDNDFWNRARNDRGRKFILDISRRPMPSNVRLFVESVLMSGTTLIKPHVFERSAIGWVGASSLRKQQEALEQLGCLHFMLQLGSPIRPVDAKELSLVALPFRCSGGIWMCAVYVRENPTGPIEEVIDQAAFEESALIYHSLFREAERRLRRKARASYTDALGKLIARATVETRKKHGDDARLCLDAVACNKFEEDMRLLTRVYPFDGIVPITPFDDKSFLPFREIDFKNEPNGYFDRLTLHKFIDEDDHKKLLRERILLASIPSTWLETDESND